VDSIDGAETPKGHLDPVADTHGIGLHVSQFDWHPASIIEVNDSEHHWRTR